MWNNKMDTFKKNIIKNMSSGVGTSPRG